jgi:hypothetical protein
MCRNRMDDSRIIKCNVCGRAIGTAMDDDQYLRIGNADLWNNTRVSCRCGHPLRWRPKIPNSVQSEEQHVIEKYIRNLLGKQKQKI